MLLLCASLGALSGALTGTLAAFLVLRRRVRPTPPVGHHDFSLSPEDEMLLERRSQEWARARGAEGAQPAISTLGREYVRFARRGRPR